MLTQHDLSDLEKYLSERGYTKLNKSFWLAYNGKRMKRFLFTTGLAFFIQYLTLIHMTFTYPPLPINPAMGAAFVMLYLLGNTTLLGLFLGSFAAYFFHGLTMSSIFLYMIADLGGSYIGVHLCRSVFSSDYAVYTHSKEGLRFVMINAFTSCLLSSVLRIVAVMLYVANPMSLKTLGYYWVNFCLADLNGIIVLSGFFLSWISVYLGREAILHKNTSKLPAKIVWLFIIMSMLVLKKAGVMVMAVMFSLYLSYYYGVLMATVSSYILIMIFLRYFVTQQQAYLNYLGLHLYTLIPCGLLSLLILVLYIGQKTSKLYYHTQMVSLEKVEIP